MSTFLELCADLARESGAIGAAPSSVTGQTGRQEKCVEWIADAWEQIQADNPEWDFLRTEFEGTLAAGTKRYTGAALGIADHAEWITGQRVSIYLSGEQENEAELDLLPYDRWRRSYDFGTHDQNKPVHYSVSAANELLIGPTPDAAYVVRGAYVRTPQELVANGDIPIAPSRFHKAIVWRANMLLCAHDEAWPAHQAAELKYKAILRNMQRDCLPAITTGGNHLG